MFFKKKIKSKLISLRTSNIIGKRLFKNARINHKLFFDNFLEYKKNKNKITVNDDFKDFLSIKQFCKVIKKIIELKISGIYNVSISERVYISELISWLDKTSINNFEFKPMSKNSFTLSNKKLIKKIKIKLTKNQLKNYCFTLFKRN